MNRLDACFAKCNTEGRGALSIYLAAGSPDAASTPDMIDAAIAGGADFLEIGIPFSDPAADGPAIQLATAAAIRAGFRVADAMKVTAAARERHPNVPFVCMTYANVAYRMGWGTFAETVANAGFDAVILPDVPLEESEPVRQALAEAGVGWIPLVTPTTSDTRMAEIAASATGFLYVVSSTGTTGQAGPGQFVAQTIARAKATGTQSPLVVGFGVTSRSDVDSLIANGADGVIVGSHIVGKISAGATPNEVRDAVADLRPSTNL